MVSTSCRSCFLAAITRPVNQARIDKAKLAEAGTQLADLLRWVGSRAVGIGQEGCGGCHGD